MITSVRLQSFLASAIIMSCLLIQSPSTALSQVIDDSIQETSIPFEPGIDPQLQLQHARKAMQQGKIEIAEFFIQSAEDLIRQVPGADSRPLTYTPQMAREDLAKLRGETPNSVSATAASPVSATNPQLAAQRTLLKARQALAHGDVETATAMLKSAEQIQTDFKTIGDSPQTIDSMIKRQNQLAELAQSGDRSYNSRAASFLLTQAEALNLLSRFRKCRDVDRASS